jgi:SAM-dependent methyltransferase
MEASNAVREHYSLPGPFDRVESALANAGLGSGPVRFSDLAPLDQFHVRGLSATKDLAHALAPEAGSRVLDLGSGLGGPARYLAAVHSCHVTGIELTPVFVEVAEMLSKRAGLADRTRFVVGDATALPFEPESFDHAWTEHVAMNIRDKARLYAGVHRALKPGGRFAIYDPVRGENGPVIYPVPWAKDETLSFLCSPTELPNLLRAAGFRDVSSADVTDEGITWFAERAAAASAPPPDGITPLNPGSVLGAEFRQWTANFAQNLREGRIRLLKIVVQKS